MIYRSSYTKEGLTARWDDLTSPARFAGANDRTDWIFNASRKEDSVRLVRKPKLAYDPFAAVFHGKIKEDKGGSCIVGYYTKSLIDYIIVAAISVIYFGVCFEYLSRSDSPLSPLILIFVGIIVIAAVLTTFPPTRKRYASLITKVTGVAAPAVSKTADEMSVADEKPADAKPDGDKDKKSAGDDTPAKTKYKFKF